MRRVPAGESQGTTPGFRWENKRSGSIFDLRPDRAQEVRLELVDPDGGSAEKTLVVRTRGEPRAKTGARVRKAAPGKIPEARPGDVVLLAAGNYGTLAPPRDGEPGRPIMYRAAKGAVFESVTLDGRKYIHLEGLTVKNLEGTAISLNGAEACAVQRCRIQATYGVRASHPPGCKNCYLADNVIAGPTPWTNEAMGAKGANKGEGRSR